MVKSSAKYKTAKIRGRYKNLKAKYNTRKFGRLSLLPAIHKVANNNANMNVTKKITKKTKKERRAEQPDTYLVEVKGLLELLTEGRDEFSNKKFERHMLIADSIMGSVSDILRDIGREIDEEEAFEFIDKLVEVINDMLDEYEAAEGEDKEGLKDEMYLLASSIRESMIKGNKIYKNLKSNPVLSPINENMTVASAANDDGLGDLLAGLSSLKIKK
jgi:hypothetical protein